MRKLPLAGVAAGLLAAGLLAGTMSHVARAQESAPQATADNGVTMPARPGTAAENGATARTGALDSSGDGAGLMRAPGTMGGRDAAQGQSQTGANAAGGGRAGDDRPQIDTGMAGLPGAPSGTVVDELMRLQREIALRQRELELSEVERDLIEVRKEIEELQKKPEPEPRDGISGETGDSAAGDDQDDGTDDQAAFQPLAGDDDDGGFFGGFASDAAQGLFGGDEGGGFGATTSGSGMPETMPVVRTIRASGRLNPEALVVTAAGEHYRVVAGERFGDGWKVVSIEGGVVRARHEAMAEDDSRILGMGTRVGGGQAGAGSAGLAGGTVRETGTVPGAYNPSTLPAFLRP